MATNTKKKSHVGILSRMLAALTATDAEPEVLEEAIDAIEDITGGEAAPVEPEQPEEEAKDEDPMAAILARLDALEAAVGAKGADEEPEEAPAEEEDPLKKLEDDLDELEGTAEEEEEEVNPDEDPDEQESHFVDPEEINEEDEDPEDEEVIEEEEEISDCKARDAVRDTIRTMRPIIAKLPKAEQKKASDALAAQLRKSYGLAPKAERNDYLRLKAARKKTADSANACDPQDLGKAIMASRNPHFKK